MAQFAPEFSPWKTVYRHWSGCVAAGITEKALRRLRRGERRRIKRQADPSALIIDSQSVKGSSSATRDFGYDAGRKIMGGNGHLLVDSQENLVDVVVHAADFQDRDGAQLILKGLATTMTRVRLIWADGGYRGKLLQCVAYTTCANVAASPCALSTKNQDSADSPSYQDDG